MAEVIRILAAALFLILSSPAFSAAVVEEAIDGNARLDGDRDTTEGATLSFDWKAEIRLGLLMGEPVVSVRFIWADPIGIVTLPQLTPSGRSYRPVHLTQLPVDLRQHPRLLDVKLRMTFSDGVSLLDHVADVGVTGPPGQWSFNVPGSPDWERLFRVHGQDAFVSENTAKTAVQNGLSLVSVELEDATISLYHLHEDYVRLYGAREEYRVLGTAYKRVLDGLQRSYGVDASGISGGWTDAYFVAENSGSIDSSKVWEERVRKLEQVLIKLSSLPEELRAGENHGPYEQAVADADLIQRVAGPAVRGYRAEGTNPDSQPQGREPMFDGAYRLALLRGEHWIVDSDSGDAIRMLSTDSEVLVAGLILYRESLSNTPCRDGNIALALHDPVSEAEVSHLDISCFLEGRTASVKEVATPDEVYPRIVLTLPTREPRKFTRTVTCRHCGRSSTRTGKLTEYYHADVTVGPDLSVTMGKEISDVPGRICPALVLCRN
ncbi:hypothetical protein [Pseudophaeobacter sp. TrK17]|uniref:hypothetical protein n=1 Tax=Pseudophaeobacter sp. TrK17 TaxID=2815167 RepID=UPI0035D00D81